MWRYQEYARGVKRTNGACRRVSRTLQSVCPAVVLMAVLCGGCGKNDGPERVIVSGAVTYNGKPVPEGNIRFMPMATSAVPVSGAIIVDGKYRGDGNGGIPVGTHKIQIEAYRVKPGPASPMGRGVPRVQYLPRRYNADSQLQITIEPGSGEIAKDFDLAD